MRLHKRPAKTLAYSPIYFICPEMFSILRPFCSQFAVFIYHISFTICVTVIRKGNINLYLIFSIFTSLHSNIFEPFSKQSCLCAVTVHRQNRTKVRFEASTPRIDHTIASLAMHIPVRAKSLDINPSPENDSYITRERTLTKMADDLQMVAVQTANCGVLHVYVQGNIDERAGKTFILTVHDIGTNHKSFVRFVNHASMNDVRNKSIFLHVCVPGQENGAADYIGDFPSLDQIGEDLAAVLDKFEIKTCIAFGEGVGANIVCRFAMMHQNRIMAIILVHCTSTTAGIIEYCKEKMMNLRLENDIMTEGAWDYLVTHKFGASDKKERQCYIDELKNTLNPRNLSKYLMAFTKRTDLHNSIGNKLDTVDALLVTGARASHLHTVYTTHKSMNKKKTTLLVADNVADVMAEAPDKLARSLILFCKGCGVLSGVAIPGMEKQRTLSSSMEEADRPRRLSVTQPQLPTVPSN